MLRMARVGFLPLVVLAACARPGPGPSQPPPGAATVPPPTSEAVATPAPPSGKPTAPQVATTPGVQAPSGAAIPPSTSKAAPPAKAKAPVKPPVEARAAPAEKPAPVESAAQKPAAPPLDLASLEDRLRNTRAIGVFTKLSLKNNVDDLIEAFREFYNGQLRTTLADLRQRYDGLVMKVLTLVQNGDPTLASAISASRDAIWGILSDRERFQKFSLH